MTIVTRRHTLATEHLNRLPIYNDATITDFGAESDDPRQFFLEEQYDSEAIRPMLVPQRKFLVVQRPSPEAKVIAHARCRGEDWCLAEE